MIILCRRNLEHLPSCYRSTTILCRRNLEHLPSCYRSTTEFPGGTSHRFAHTHMYSAWTVQAVQSCMLHKSFSRRTISSKDRLSCAVCTARCPLLCDILLHETRTSFHQFRVLGDASRLSATPGVCSPRYDMKGTTNSFRRPL